MTTAVHILIRITALDAGTAWWSRSRDPTSLGSAGSDGHQTVPVKTPNRPKRHHHQLTRQPGTADGTEPDNGTGAAHTPVRPWTPIFSTP